MSFTPDERDPTGRFVRGLTLGALLGAIIAGSSLWSKARARRRPSDWLARPEPSGTPPVDEPAVSVDRDRSAD